MVVSLVFGAVGRDRQRKNTGRRGPGGGHLRRLGLCLLFLGILAAGQGEARSVIYTNGAIWTGDPARPWATALWVRDGVIEGVGDEADLLERAGENSSSLDLEGSFVCPGIVDAHAHILSLGLSLERVDLVGAATLEEARNRVARAVAARDAEGIPQAWIRGWGWDQNDWPDEQFPVRQDLDEVSGSHPIALTRVDGHALWVNTQALEAAGITSATLDPPGGRILHDPTGDPTGILIDRAADLVREAMPPTGEEAKRRAILEANDLLVRQGVTGVHDMGMSAEEVGIYRRLAGEGHLKIRIYGAIHSTDSRLEEVLAQGPDREWEGGTFKLGMVKFYCDGALGSRGAALLAPYRDDPGNTGLLLLEADDLELGLRNARRAGFQCAVHAIGDRANREVLDTWGGLAVSRRQLLRGTTVPMAPLSLAGGVEPRIPPLRLEHAQILAPEDLPRVGELGVLASVQPTHCTSDMPWAEDRLGPERLLGAYAWRSLRLHGATVAFGSDFPIESPNPMFGLYAAVTRAPLGARSGEGWSAGERFSREEALAAFTAVPAFASGDLHRLGTLTPAKRADFLVLDRNLITCESAEILKARVLATVVDGQTAWLDPSAPFASHMRELP